MCYLCPLSLHGIVSSSAPLTVLQPDTRASQHNHSGPYEHVINLERSTFGDCYETQNGQHLLVYGDRQRQHVLSTLIRIYPYTTYGTGVETLIMHGSLLGWYWGRKVLPWETNMHV
jgi:hypothetical protein